MENKQQVSLVNKLGYLSLRTKLILGFSLIAAFASLVTSFATYTNTQRQIIENFRRRALTAASITALQQNGDEFERITSGSDPLYESFRLKNFEILKSDPDFVFVYTMRKDAQGIYFVVDGNDPTAEGFSPYGERYLEPSTLLVENFDSMTGPIVEPGIYTDEYGSFLSAYAPIFSSDGRHVGVVGVDIAADVIVQEQRQILYGSILVSLAVMVIGVLLGNLAGNAITRPIIRLAQGALAFASGRFDQRINITSNDEIGDLTKTFNSVADQLQFTMNALERRVSDRTIDLKNAVLVSEKRARELQTISEISRLISSEQRLDILLNLVTRLVSERFNFYHVGIFFVNDTRQFAVLQAANSEGGQKMLDRGHRLEVGQTGIVGNVAQTGKPRIALDVGSDAIFFNNPDLPNTRSEMALPLNVHGQTIGVLDVQSTVPGAFTENDTHTLGILADQVAIAIDNARLFGQMQQARQEAEALYAQTLRKEWSTFSKQQRRIGYRQSLTGGKPLEVPIETEEIREALKKGQVVVLDGKGPKAQPAIAVPVKLRGLTIGVLNIKAPTPNRKWSQEEINLAQAISDRLALALENARLFEETRSRAERERMVSDITSKIRSQNDPQAMIQTAISELRNALGASRVEIIPQVMQGEENKKAKGAA
jgi:GAF domain-containing protein/HAMP domain-containing protein